MLPRIVRQQINTAAHGAAQRHEHALRTRLLREADERLRAGESAQDVLAWIDEQAEDATE